MKCTLRSLQCPKIAASQRPPLRNCIVHQTRPISFESITIPFSRKELKAAATGNPDLSSEYYLLYVGTIICVFLLMKGPLARRIATYKIGAFLLSACGLAVSPVVAATAEVPLMALPGTYNVLNTHSSRIIIIASIIRLSLSNPTIRPFHASLRPSPGTKRSPHVHFLRQFLP